MEKYTKEELLEMLPTDVRDSKELTTKQKIVLGQLLIYNGLDMVKKNGYFYRSNRDLCSDCDIQESQACPQGQALLPEGHDCRDRSYTLYHAGKRKA